MHRAFAVFLGGAALMTCATGSTWDSARALTMQECSAKYKEAQTAGTLKGMTWNDFRKAQCGSDADAATKPTPATANAPADQKSTTPAAAAKPAAGTTAKAPADQKPATPAATAATSPASGNAVFPKEVAPKYAKDPPGKARMQTCLDQYNANKENNGNGGLTWIQKGGGYYSECTKRLKG